MDFLLASTILPTTLTGYFIMAVAIMIAVTIMGRYIYFNVTGNKTAAKLDNFYKEIRTLIFNVVEHFEPVIRAEKYGGRDAAKKEINLLIVKFIKETTVLRDAEKAIILKFDMSFLVNEIEEELVERGLLPSVTNIGSNVNTSNPEEESSG